MLLLFSSGTALPRLGILSGSLVLASTDVPALVGSILTLTDTLVFDPEPDTKTVVLQSNDGGGWSTVAHDIVATPYEIPEGAEGTSYRVRAVAVADGYSNRTVYSNTHTVAVPVSFQVVHNGDRVVHETDPVVVIL